MPLRVEPSRDRKLTRMFGKAEGRPYRRGSRIFTRGDAARRVFLVREGHVRLTLPDPPAGRERTAALAGPWELFGEEALLPDARRSHGAWAGEDCAVVALDGEDVHHAIRGSRRSYAAFVRSRAEDVLAARRRAALLACSSTGARLADLLLELADRFGLEEEGGAGGDGSLRVPHWFTHQELADLSGAHRSTVTTLLNDWIYEGILGEATDALLILRPHGLEAAGTGIRELFPPSRR